MTVKETVASYYADPLISRLLPLDVRVTPPLITLTADSAVLSYIGLRTYSDGYTPMFLLGVGYPDNGLTRYELIDDPIFIPRGDMTAGSEASAAELDRLFKAALDARDRQALAAYNDAVRASLPASLTQLAASLVRGRYE